MTLVIATPPAGTLRVVSAKRLKSFTVPKDNGTVKF